MNEVDEGVLDPWVADWIAANGALMEQPADYTAEYLAAARMPSCPFPTREMARVSNEYVGDIPVRVYEHETPPDGLVVYFHGGAFCVGSIGLMENVATEIAHSAHAAVVSVDYRLAPEHPYPAGLNDCETVTRWALDNAGRFDVEPTQIVIAGESAGGNLAAAVALRFRDERGPEVAGQLLLYPGLAPASASFPSRTDFSGPMLKADTLQQVWSMYCGERDLDNDCYASPLQANDLSGLPAALVVLGGCDVLRDEGRLYANRLRDAGVAVKEECYAGQPHGFLNLGFPAATQAYEKIGEWLRGQFE